MSRQQILEIAQSQDQVREQPINITPYGQWYGLDGQPWCAIFVSWVFYQAGHPLPYIDTQKGFHSCHNGFDYWSFKGLFTNNPKPGDIVLYDFHEGGKKSDHTGIYSQSIDFQRFEAWEGNTSPYNDRNGGMVMRQKRHIQSVVAFIDVSSY